MLQKAKALRKHQTDAEQKLWFHLRGKRFSDVKFKRQKPIGSYVVDFVATNEKLIIELDGGQHQERMAYDQERTNYLESCGYRVLRFWNNECLTEIDTVLDRIWLSLFPNVPSPAPSGHPLPQAGEGKDARLSSSNSFHHLQGNGKRECGARQ
jgi:very-short-patch-repair endonuclease